MESPKDSHWQTGKRISRYVSDTKYLGIMYSTSENFKLISYTDNDNGGNIDDRKSTFGYIFYIGTCVVSWASKKQPIITSSSTEGEYVAITVAACQAVWMHRFLKDLL